MAAVGMAVETARVVMAATANLATLDMETEAATATDRTMEEEEAMVEMAAMAVVAEARVDLAQDRVVVSPSILCALQFIDIATERLNASVDYKVK